jgi:sporulation protein YlmC with PRC-barrel domain
MLICLTELKSYRIEATDGDVGRIDDLLFFRGEWVVRYLVAATEDRDTEPMLAVADIRRLDRRRHILFINISREEVSNAHTVDVEQSPDESDEDEGHELYGWPPYWLEEGREVAPMGTESGAEEPVRNPDAEEFEGPELQRASDLPGLYSIQTDGGEAGTLKDFVVEDETWAIPYLAIDTNTSVQAARRVLVATDYVQRVDWLGKSIQVSLSIEDVAGSPAFTSEEPITLEFEHSLRGYYDRYSK